MNQQTLEYSEDQYWLYLITNSFNIKEHKQYNILAFSLESLDM